jgi:hypothetical protein
MLEAAATERTAMADRGSLRIIGFILSGVAAVVIGVGVFVVQSHLTGKYIVEDTRPVVSNSLPIVRR